MKEESKGTGRQLQLIFMLCYSVCL